jgi:ATP-binding cassette subfamily B protein
MWRLCKLGYRHEPRLLVAAFLLSLAAALPDALLALWLALLGKGVVDGDRRLLLVAATGLGLSAALTWILRTVDARVQRRFRDRVTIALEAHVARLQASVATIAHQERPEWLDRLTVLREQVFVLDHLYMSLFSTAGWVLRLGVTVGLLVSISPWLAALALFALPTILTSAWRPAVERRAQERGAQSSRLARHLYQTATTAPPGKEVRVAGIGDRLAADRRAAWERWYGPLAAARRTSAVWHALAWAVFGAGYVGAVVVTATVLDAGPAAVLLVLAAGSRWRPRPTCQRPGPSPPGSGWSGCRSPTRAATASPWTTCPWSCPPGRWWPWSARTAPARRPWSSCCASCTSRPRAGSWSTTGRWTGSTPPSGARGWPGRSRTSSASS